MADNKVRYGFKNVYYSVIDKSGETFTFSIPKKWPGAKSITLDVSGDSSIFYADDIAFFTTSNMSGYTGTLEMSYITDDIKKEIYGYLETKDGLLVEVLNAQPKDVALLFECQGDAKAKRHCFYQCSLARPSFEAETKGESIDPKTVSIGITITPIAVDENDIASCVAAKGATGYETFFTTAPKLPTEFAEA